MIVCAGSISALRVETEVGKIHRVGTHVGDPNPLHRALRHARVVVPTAKPIYVLLPAAGRRGEGGAGLRFGVLAMGRCDCAFLHRSRGLCFVGRGAVDEFGFQLYLVRRRPHRRASRGSCFRPNGDLAFALDRTVTLCDRPDRRALCQSTGERRKPTKRSRDLLLTRFKSMVRRSRWHRGWPVRDFMKHDTARIGRVSLRTSARCQEMASPSRSSSEANQMVSLFLAWSSAARSPLFLSSGGRRAQKSSGSQSFHCLITSGRNKSCKIVAKRKRSMVVLPGSPLFLHILFLFWVQNTLASSIHK